MVWSAKGPGCAIGKGGPRSPLVLGLIAAPCFFGLPHFATKIGIGAGLICAYLAGLELWLLHYNTPEASLLVTEFESCGGTLRNYGQRSDPIYADLSSIPRMR